MCVETHVLCDWEPSRVLIVSCMNACRCVRGGVITNLRFCHAACEEKARARVGVVRRNYILNFCPPQALPEAPAGGGKKFGVLTRFTANFASPLTRHALLHTTHQQADASATHARQCETPANGHS